jgi:ankyrin repeat protein
VARALEIIATRKWPLRIAGPLILDADDHDLDVALIYCSFRGHASIVSILLKRCMGRVNVRDLLEEASYYGRVPVVRVLVDFLKAREASWDLKPALESAVVMGHPKVVQVLVQTLVDVAGSPVSSDLSGAMWTAIHKEGVRVVSALLQVVDASDALSIFVDVHGFDVRSRRDAAILKHILDRAARVSSSN